jgi:hypothetical protein
VPLFWYSVYLTKYRRIYIYMIVCSVISVLSILSVEGGFESAKRIYIYIYIYICMYIYIYISAPLTYEEA